MLGPIGSKVCASSYEKAVIIVLVWNAILKVSFSMHDIVRHHTVRCDSVLSLFATSLRCRYDVKTLIIIIVIY